MKKLREILFDKLHKKYFNIALITVFIGYFLDVIVDNLSLFGIIILFLFIVILIFYFMASVNYFHKNYKAGKIKAAIPFIIMTCSLSLLFYFPFRELKVDIDNFLFKSQRNDVVEKIKSGEYKAPNCYMGIIKLPLNNIHLSNSGDVLVFHNCKETTIICFYVSRGMLSPSMLVIYNSKDELPSSKQLNSEIMYSRKLQENWYYIKIH